MRLTLFLVVGLCMQVAANVHAQRLSLDVRNQNLSQVLQELRRQTGYAFVYRDSDVADVSPITLKVQDKEIMEVLPVLFAELPLQYKVQDKVISIARRPQKAVATKDETTIAPQRYIIRGIVVNNEGTPLSSASVVLLNNGGQRTQLQTKTGEAGEFVIAVNPNTAVDQVEISHLGYQTVVLTAKEDMGIVVMQLGSADLEEVVVKSISTGYQRIKPEQSTGAVAQLSTKEYESRISTNFLDGLVNRMPGLMINNDVIFENVLPNGVRNDRPLFNIRGISTMSANQQPLIVVDGYPTELTLDMIDPNEIQSVTILKDAAASTVYGVRASNGVIVIERKQAVVGKPRFAFRATAGVRPEEDYTRYRWADDASAIVTDYQRTTLDANINNTSWEQLLTPAPAFGGTVRRSPVYYILAQQAGGMITDEQAERAFDELKGYDNLSDYQRLFTRPAVTQMYNFNVSGGNDNALYYITANYTKNHHSNMGNDDNRFLLSARSTLKLSSKLLLELTTDYQEDRDNGRPVPGVTDTNPFERFQDVNGNPAAIIGQSIASRYNGLMMSQGLDDHMYYPLVDFNAVTDKSHTVNNRITANFVYKLGAGLDLSFNGIYETSRFENRYYAAEESSPARQLVNSYVERSADGALRYHVPQGGYLRQNNARTSSYTARVQLNYNKVVAQSHSFNGIVGAEVRNLTNTGNVSSYFGYNDETLLHQPMDFASMATGAIRGTYQLGAPLQNSFNNWFTQRYVEDRFVSGYANLVYAYKNTYSLTGSIRVDQSNLFGTNPKYRYKPLWSLGAAWNIHREDFMQNAGWVDLLKLRMAYGFNGNVAKMSLPEVIARTVINNYISPASPTLQLLSYANSSLRWEQTGNFNVGLDYQIFKNIEGNIDYYQKISTDLLGNALIDPTIGVSPSLINQASIRNKGIEFGLRADWIARPDFNWNTGISLSRNTSMVTDMFQRVEFNPSTVNAVGYIKDYPVGALFAFRYGGLDENGFPLIRDEAGNVYPTTDNSAGSPTTRMMASDTSGVIRYMGTSIPTLNAGLSNRVDFGRFYIFCMVHYYGGFKMRVPRPDPSHRRPLEGAGTFWRQPGDEERTEVMGLEAYTKRTSNDAYNYADSYVVNGDYITLGDLTLSYRIDHLPALRRAGFSNFEIKGQASNIWTVGLNKYNYSRATGSFQKSFITPTYTLGIFTNF